MGNQSLDRRVLFVCMGNICRSPTGEAVMQHLVVERDVAHRVLVDSAGTIGYHVGAPADARMREAASRRGYRMQSRSRQVTRADLEQFDLIVAMDRDNLDDLQALDTSGQYGDKIRLLSEFLPEGSPQDVPDPYYGGDQGFECVLDMIENACPNLLDHLLQ